MTRRRSHHVDYRGNTRDRIRRREYLMKLYGNGRTIVCYHCKRRVRCFEVDRYPIPGIKGGRYTRSNIVPSCRRCNRPGRFQVSHRNMKWRLESQT
jgi:hypothetical protein